MKTKFLKPGEIFYSKEDFVVDTILGSCVSVCFYDKVQRCGAINHFVMPYSNGDVLKNEENKYAKQSIVNLLKIFKNEFKSRKKDIEVKVLGGASVSKENSKHEVGKKNIEAALDILAEFGFTPKSKLVGGNQGIKLKFNFKTGEINYRYIKKQQVVERDEAQKVNDKIKVLIVDDSKTIRKVLRNIIETNPLMDVIGEAEDPYHAMEIRKKEKPDVITLDINMPKMDGVSYLKTYMRTDPIPTIIITDYNLGNSSPVFEALENGAFDYIKKPSFTDIEAVKGEIIDKIKTANSSKNKIFLKPKMDLLASTQNFITLANEKIDRSLIVIGSSTGGTEALKKILLQLPENIPPIVIVQHIPPVFSKAFADRLNELCLFNVKEADDNEKIERHTVYIAPGGKQLKIVKRGVDLVLVVNDDPPVNQFKPSVDYLFKSVVGIRSKNILGIILTGMGSDGAEGLLELKDNGAVTIAQDEKTSVVFGMPGSAIDRGAVTYVEALDDISSRICKTINSHNKWDKYKKVA